MPHILGNKETACQLLVHLSLFRLEDPNSAVESVYRIQSFSVVWLEAGSFVLQLVHIYSRTNIKYYY